MLNLLSDSISVEEIKAIALQMGWDDVAVTTPAIPEEDIRAYHLWVTQGLHADLTYMENTLRCDPEQLLPGAKSAIIFASNYKQAKQPFKKGEGIGLVASYARGRDYHHVHRKRLKKFIAWLEQRSGVVGCAKGFSDSTPIMEKSLAVKSGLAWFGKNSLLIHRKLGTFFLISGVLTTLDVAGVTIGLRLPRCGSCTRCIDACPTQAIIRPYTIAAERCLSYHTIESKKEIPEEIARKNPGYIFGCDICQDVCPHNFRKPDSEHDEFMPHNGNGAYLDENSLALLEMQPEKLHGTPLQRRKVTGLKHTFSSFNEHNQG